MLQQFTWTCRSLVELEWIVDCSRLRASDFLVMVQHGVDDDDDDERMKFNVA